MSGLNMADYLVISWYAQDVLLNVGKEPFEGLSLSFIQHTHTHTHTATLSVCVCVCVCVGGGVLVGLPLSDVKNRNKNNYYYNYKYNDIINKLYMNININIVRINICINLDRYQMAKFIIISYAHMCLPVRVCEFLTHRCKNIEVEYLIIR